MSGESGVRLDQQGAVATITMAGPALTTTMKTQLVDAVRRVAADNAVRAVVLTGTGRAFCAGQDLFEHAEAVRADPAAAFATVRDHYNPIVLGLTEMPKPVIASINGACVGAGLGLALACDLRIAADTAKFGTAFTTVGLSCDSGLSATLVRAVGAARASELVLQAKMFDADKAYAWGIVGEVVPAADLAKATEGMAAGLAGGPTLAYAEAKRALAASWQPPLADVLAAEAAAQTRLGGTKDHVNAVAAFTTKTTPEFHGH